VAVYGTLYHPDLDSTFARPRAADAYGRDKLFAERIVRTTFRRGRVRWFILRVGHVYGPEQGHSLDFLDRIRTEGFRLPFHGEQFSNAVHVDRLALSIAALCEDIGIQPGVFNACDPSSSTWGEVFDLHSTAAGLPPVARMPEPESEALRGGIVRGLRRSRLREAIVEFRRAAAGIPAVVAQGSASRDLGYNLLSHLPASLNASVKRRYTRWQAKLQTGVATEAPVRSDSWHFFSSGVPGPNIIEVAGGRSEMSAHAISDDLAEWISGILPPAWCGRVI
jgi:nucleoside-diphosphate-sugar epimerase